VPADYRKEPVRKIASGPSSYPTGGFEVEIGELEKVEGAVVTVESGTFYHPQIVSITDNKVKIKVWEWTGTEIAEVGAGTDLSGVKFHILAWSP